MFLILQLLNIRGDELQKICFCKWKQCDSSAPVRLYPLEVGSHPAQGQQEAAEHRHSQSDCGTESIAHSGPDSFRLSILVTSSRHRPLG